MGRGILTLGGEVIVFNETYKISVESLKFEQIITTALIGISAVAVIQLLQVTALDVPLKVSLYCFAISIPMLALYLLIILSKPNYKLQSDMWADQIAVYTGGFCSVVGIAAIFWHFSVSIGITFIITSIFAYILIRIWVSRMNRINHSDENTVSA